MDSREGNPIGRKTTLTKIQDDATKKKFNIQGDATKPDINESVVFCKEDVLRRRPGLHPVSVENCVLQPQNIVNLCKI